MVSYTGMRSIIARCLGAIWILDGLLQFQPRMFGMDFVNQVLAPNLAGQPSFLHAIISFGISVWMVNPVLANTFAGLIQITIGVLLWFPGSTKEFKIGLYLSIVWTVIVWLFGEGAGLLFVGIASFYIGAPGAVLFYGLLAILFLVPKKISTHQFPKVGGVILILGAALQLQPSFWTASGVQGSIMGATMESVRALSVVPSYIAGILSVYPIASNVILVAVPLVLGLLLIFKPNRVTGIAALAFLFLVWWWGQDFGGLSTIITGTCTDPNSAPLVALFVLPLFFKGMNL